MGVGWGNSGGDGGIIFFGTSADGSCEILGKRGR